MKQAFVILFSLVATLLLSSGNSYGQKKDSLSAQGRLFTMSAEPTTYMIWKPTNDVEVWDGKNIIAYKKKDSSWVLINPDKTKIILDSVISIMFKKPKNQP